MSKNIKVAFLFGAGAEQGFGLPSGKSFSNLTLPLDKSEWHESILEALKIKFSNYEVLERYVKWLPKYRRDIITKREIKKWEDKNDNNISFGVLERLFHTVINPCKYGENKFWKVFNFYWFAYFTVLDPLVSRCTRFESFMEHNRNTDSYSLILDNLECFTKALYEEPWSYTFKEHLYYNQDYFNETNKYRVAGILTTNYTPLVNITGISNNKISYLNGRMNQFEYPYELVIKDFTKDSREFSDFYFPFVMAQSALKPIIAPQQIKEYRLASDILNESDVLVIIGYNINEDDNHINSFIVDFLRHCSLNKVIFCEYSPLKRSYNKNSCHLEICKRLRLANYDEQIDVVRNEGDPAKLFTVISEKLAGGTDIL